MRIPSRLALLFGVGMLFANVGCGMLGGSSGSPSAPLPLSTSAAPPTAIAPATTSAAPAPAALPTLIVAGTATLAAPSAKGGACDLPYFPVQGGATWKYHWSAGSVASDETFTISSVTANGLTRHLTFSNSAGAADEQWTCSAEGITNPQSSVASMTTSTGGSSTQVRVLSHNGISLPAANMWKAGASWSESSRLEETIAIGGKSGSPVQVAVDETSRIVGQEKVQVPAGTFTALRVDSALVEHLGKTDLSIPSSSWYAPGIGQVKVTSGMGNQSITVELISFKP